MARTPTERAKRILGIKPYGLSALSAVAKAADALPKSSAARHDMERLAADLACTVCDVRFAGLPISSAGRTELTSLRGKTLTTDRLVWLLQTAGKCAAKNTLACSLTASRDGDGTGFVVEFCFTRKRATGGGSDFSEFIGVGTEQLFNSVGGGYALPWSDSAEHSAFARRCDKAFAADWRQVVRFVFSFAPASDERETSCGGQQV